MVFSVHDGQQSTVHFGTCQSQVVYMFIPKKSVKNLHSHSFFLLSRSEAESSSLAASQALQGDRSPGGSPDKNSAPSQSSESSGVLGTMYGMLVGSGSNADLSKAPMTVNVTAPPPPPPSGIEPPINDLS